MVWDKANTLKRDGDQGEHKDETGARGNGAKVSGSEWTSRCKRSRDWEEYKAMSRFPLIRTSKSQKTTTSETAS